MARNPSRFTACGDTCPVDNVSWNDITGPNGFLAKLNKLTGQKYRLPSEAEWEYAARAGAKTAYWLGKDDQPWAGELRRPLRLQGGSKGAYRQKTVKADEFGANDWGLFNVHGNVREWVQDCWHGSYQGAAQTGAGVGDELCRLAARAARRRLGQQPREPARGRSRLGLAGQPQPRRRLSYRQDSITLGLFSLQVSTGVVLAMTNSC